MFRAQKTLKKTRIKLHSTVTMPALLHGSNNWTVTARETAAEMKYIRNTAAGYTWTDCKTKREIAEELNTAPVLDKIQDY
jgi:hypothetical protein